MKHDEKTICDIYNERTVEYYKKMRKQAFFNEYLVNPKMRKIIISLASANKKILDIGCGYGADLEFLAKKGIMKLTGIDVSEYCVDAAKENKYLRGVARIYRQSINKIGLSEKHDIAFSNMVLDQVKDLDTAFANVADSLVKNGYYIFSVTHPLSTATRDYDKQLVNYFDRSSGTVNPKTLNKKLFYYKRTIEDYSRSLRKNGFVIHSLYEPRPTKKAFAAHHDKSMFYDRLPAALIICAQLLK